MKPKIIFFGSDQYSQIVLEKILKDQRFGLAAIVTLPNAKNIQKLAQKAHIPFFSLDEILKSKLAKKYRPEVGVLASFGKIIPQANLQIPKHGILNIHPSLLPQYRGPTPVPTAILNGETQTGVSIIKMDEQVDHGPIIAQFKLDVFPQDDSESLLTRCFTAGIQVLLTILPSYLKGKIKPRQQDHSKATLTPKLTREDGFIPPEILALALESTKKRKHKEIKNIQWPNKKIYTKSLNLYNLGSFLDRLIRSMQPWPGTFTNMQLKKKQEIASKRLKILKAHLENDQLVLDQVQLEGKNSVTWKQFLEGYSEAKLV